MSLHRTRYAVRINGSLRILFTILEKPNGELIIPMKTGERAESKFGPRLLEQRYSVHPSPQSLEFTTIKQTVNTDDGKTETSVILTDAAKLKTGFAIVFVRRIQDLTPERYEIKSANRKAERTYVVADLDPALHTLFIGVFIGHPDTPFHASNDGIVVSHFPFKEFKVIILSTARIMPVHYSTDYAHAVTFPPETFPDTKSQVILRTHMQGKSPDICTRQFFNSVRVLEKMLWEKGLLEVTEPHFIEFIKQRIAEIDDFTLGPSGLDTGPRSTHTLSDEKSPNPQSAPLPPEFSRRIGRIED
jgi:hypothetical protein